MTLASESEPHAIPAEQGPTHRQNVVLLANATAGSGKAADQAARAVELIAHGGHRVVGPDCLTTPFADQIRALEAGGYDTVLAIGGDGTVNVGAKAAVAHDATLVIVPTGTMNLVARDLGIADDVDAAIRQLDHPRETAIDYATINGHMFLHSVFLGIVPTLARDRELVRSDRGMASACRAAARGLRDAFTSPAIRVRIESDRGSDTLTTRSLGVSNNLLADELPFTFKRRSVSAGEMGVYASAHRGVAAPLRLLMTLGTGTLAQDDETLSAGCTEATLRLRKARIDASIDGEITQLTPPLRCLIHPRALRVTVPSAGERGGPA